MNFGISFPNFSIFEAKCNLRLKSSTHHLPIALRKFFSRNLSTKKPYQIDPLYEATTLNSIWGNNVVKAIVSFKDLRISKSRGKDRLEIIKFFAKYASKAICNAANIPFAFLAIYLAVSMVGNHSEAAMGFAITFFVFLFLVSYASRKMVAKYIENRMLKSKWAHPVRSSKSE